ncbi:hypothetical protein C8J57DRAFT_1297101 [Mycena rebaudengoi]|nr:hypothetical protein C8J57DRAFT_1297101 [Mycena rebaudengoi]
MSAAPEEPSMSPAAAPEKFEDIIYVALLDATVGILNDQMLFLKSTCNTLIPHLHRIRTPRLCKTAFDLALDEGNARVQAVDRVVRRITTQLERSGAAQLTVNLNLYSMDNARVVLEHSTRIRSLEVSGDTKWILALVEDLPKHEFRILRSLSLIPDFDELYDTRPSEN